MLQFNVIENLQSSQNCSRSLVPHTKAYNRTNHFPSFEIRLLSRQIVCSLLRSMKNYTKNIKLPPTTGLVTLSIFGVSLHQILPSLASSSDDIWHMNTTHHPLCWWPIQSHWGHALAPHPIRQNQGSGKTIKCRKLLKELIGLLKYSFLWHIYNIYRFKYGCNREKREALVLTVDPTPLRTPTIVVVRAELTIVHKNMV